MSAENQTQNFQAKHGLSDLAIELLINFAVDGDLWGYADPDDEENKQEYEDINKIYEIHNKLKAESESGSAEDASYE